MQLCSLTHLVQKPFAFMNMGRNMRKLSPPPTITLGNRGTCSAQVGVEVPSALLSVSSSTLYSWIFSLWCRNSRHSLSSSSLENFPDVFAYEETAWCDHACPVISTPQGVQAPVCRPCSRAKSLGLFSSSASLVTLY